MKADEEISVLKKIMQLSLPVMMGEIMFSLMSFVDRFFIARLGIIEAAGASLSSTVIWVLMTVSALITGGCVALVARRTGENNYEERAKSAEQSLFLALFFGVIIAVAGYFLSPHIMAFYKAEAEVERLGAEYLSILVLGYPMVMIAHTAASVFQAGGDTKTPMKIFITMSIINIILDPIMIFGLGPVPAMGVKGAALATLISGFIACSAIVIIIFRHKEYGLSIKRTFIPDLPLIKKLLSIGGWSGLNSLSRPLSAIFLQRIITFHGTAAVAGFSFGVQWISIVFIFMQGMRVSISTLVGQFLGSRRFSDAVATTKAALKLGYVFVAVVSVIGVSFAKEAISVFTTDPDVVAAGSAYLFIIYIGMFFHVPMTVYAAGFNGAGHTAPPMITSFAANWVGKIGFAYVTTYIFGLGINWVWAGITLSLVMEGVGLSLWFKTGSWMRKSV